MNCSANTAIFLFGDFHIHRSLSLPFDGSICFSGTEKSVLAIGVFDCQWYQSETL